MIDLLKNYKELNNATGYMGTVRYNLAKRRLDVLIWCDKDPVHEVAKQ